MEGIGHAGLHRARAVDRRCVFRVREAGARPGLCTGQRHRDLAPVLMLLASRAAWPELRRSRALEAVALVGLVAGVSVLALSPKTPLAFLAFPGLVIAALRFRQIGAAVASLLVASIAVWITARG